MILMSLQWAKLGLILRLRDFFNKLSDSPMWLERLKKRWWGFCVCQQYSPLSRVRLLDSSIELEHLCLEIKQHQSGPKILFIVIYRLPNSSPVFCKFLDELMDISTSKYNEVIAVGDFNIDLLAVNGSCRLSTIFRDAGMKQIISSSTPIRVTRCSAALLDHVYVTHPERII